MTENVIRATISHSDPDSTTGDLQFQKDHFNHMEKIISISAAVICMISVVFNWGYYFGTSDTASTNFDDRLTKIESQNDRTQDRIKDIESQLAYIRGYLSKQALNNTAVNFNVDQAIKASSEINLPPSEFTQIFSTINSMQIPAAKKYLKEKTNFSDEQINAILKPAM